MDYRRVVVDKLEFADPTQDRSSGWSTQLLQPAQFQTPQCTVLGMLDAGSNSIDLDLATASELAAFIKDVEDRYVQWIVNNRQAFFGNDNCTVERFNSHVKEDSVRFGCKGAILFDPQGKVIDAIPAHTRVSAIVEIGDGWFFQGQWGVKMKCSQVKAYKRVPQQCGFVDDGDAVLTESLCSGSMPSTPPAMDTCGFRDD